MLRTASVSALSGSRFVRGGLGTPEPSSS
jgi:hypothetical protein